MRLPTRALLLDTNLLLLFLIGGKDPQLIVNSRRLNAYEKSDYFLMADFIEANNFNQLISTPHILAEVSNLLGQESKIIKQAGREAIKEYTQNCEEITHGAYLLVNEPEYHRLGLTDVAIRVASELPAFVLTADAALYIYLAREGVQVANFNHVRQGSWS
jgi:rRNA-processing protein FCF1